MANFDELGRVARGLYDRWADDSERAARRYASLMQNYDFRDIDRDTMRDNYMRYAGEEAVRYPQAVARLSLDYYRGLLDLALTASERFYDQVLANRVRQGEPSEIDPVSRGPVPSRRRVALELRGPVGGRAGRSFVIENNRDAPADIIFLTSDFVSQGQAESLRPPLTFSPPRLRLGAKESREVKIELPLPAKMFKPNERYEATVILGGYEELELGLTLLTEEAETKSTERAT